MSATLPLALFAEGGTRLQELCGRAAGPRWLAVHLPAFRLERCGWEADALVVLTAERRNATRIVALTPAAREAGLVEEMVLAEARALVPGLHVEPLDAAGEAADRHELVAAFEVLGDRVAADGDDGLLLEVAATSARLGGEAPLLAQARARAEALGHRCRLAVADHPRAARALARQGVGDVVVRPGEGAQALASLPLAALEPGEALAEALAALGLRTVGAWARLEAASVAGRFGAEGVELHRVARGLPGGAWVELPPPPGLEPLRVPLDEDAHDVEAVLRAIGGGLDLLRGRLAACDRVLARLDVQLELAWGGGHETLTVRVACPTRASEVLLRLVRGRLEQVTLSAPVRGIVLHALEVVPDGGGQQDLLARREGRAAWSELLARLGDVLGDDAVVEASPRPSWQPEAAWVARPVHGASASAGRPPVLDDPVERQEGAGWTAPRPRPTLLRSPPLPLRVRETQGRPEAVQARQGWRPVRRARGPERLGGAWWQPEGGFDRTYWVVALAEGTAWLFQERGQWFLHGWFD